MRISTKLSIAAAISGLIGAPLAGLTIRHLVRSALVSENVIHLQKDAETRMTGISRSLFRASQQIQLVAEDLSIEWWLESGKAPPLERPEIEELALLTGPWDLLAITDATGIVRLDSQDRLSGEHVRDEKQIEDVVASALAGRPAYSEVIKSRIIGRPTIVFAAPIRSEEVGRRDVVGAAVGWYGMPVLYQVLDDVTASIRPRILNAAGQVVVARSTERHLVLAPGSALPPALAGSRSEARSAIYDAGDRMMIGALAPERGIPHVSKQWLGTAL